MKKVMLITLVIFAAATFAWRRSGAAPAMTYSALT